MGLDRNSGLGHLLIGQPALASIVARSLATKGQQPQTISGDYELGITALDLTDFPYRYLRRSPTFEAGTSQAAVAAQNSIIALAQLNGVSGRTVAAVVEQIVISNPDAAAQTIAYSLDQTGTGASFTLSPNPADDRFGVAVGSFAVGKTTNAVAKSQPNASLVRVPAGSSVIIPGPWVLSGAGSVLVSALKVEVVNVNVALTVAFRWYERELLSSEL